MLKVTVSFEYDPDSKKIGDLSADTKYFATLIMEGLKSCPRSIPVVTIDLPNGAYLTNGVVAR